MNILLTGGAGFIGSHTAVELIEAGHTPIIVDSLVNSDPEVYKNLKKITNSDVIHYENDCRDTAKMVRIMKKHKCQAVIHFAAYKAVGESVATPLKYYTNNLDSLTSILDAMELASVNEFIFSSSCTIYGDPKKLPITEKSPIQPATNPYGATKQMAERIIEDVCASSSIRAVMLRYFNPIGAHPSSHIGELPIGTPNCLVPYLTQATAQLRDPLTVYGDDYDTPDGSAIRDYIHVVDLAKAHVKSMDYLKTSHKDVSVFNIGTGTGTSVLEVIDKFQKVTGEQVPYRVGPRREGDVAQTYASPKLAQRVLGWSAEKSIDEALLDAWNWQLELAKKPHNILERAEEMVEHAETAIEETIRESWGMAADA